MLDRFLFWRRLQVIVAFNGNCFADLLVYTFNCLFLHEFVDVFQTLQQIGLLGGIFGQFLAKFIGLLERIWRLLCIPHGVIRPLLGDFVIQLNVRELNRLSNFCRIIGLLNRAVVVITLLMQIVHWLLRWCRLHFLVLVYLLLQLLAFKWEVIRVVLNIDCARLRIRDHNFCLF